MTRLPRATFASLATTLALALGALSLIDVAYAQKSDRRSDSVTPSRSSSQGQSKRVQFKKNTKVDFDDELIEGGVKNPFQSMIGSRDTGNKRGFIRVRKEWHDQMVMSVNGLSQ